MKTQNKPHRLLDLNNLLILSTAFLTLFLAFIDEGRYNFVWVLDVGSWVAILLYFVLIFGIQWLFFKVIFGKFQIAGKVISLLIIVLIILLMIKLGV